MKKLKKFAALLLAGVMVMALLTACGGGTGEDAQAEASMMSAINDKRTGKHTTALSNDPELKDEANQFLHTVVNIDTGIINIKDMVDIKTDPQTKITTIKVVVDNRYTGTLLENFFEKVNSKDKNVDISAVGKWTKVGVAAKTVKGNTYVSVVVQVNLNA